MAVYDKIPDQSKTQPDRPMKTTTELAELIIITGTLRFRHILYVAQFAAIVLLPSKTLFSQTESPSVITTSEGQSKKPNILVIMGDDIGWYNPSIYHRGDMGYWTPNIDRIGKEGEAGPRSSSSEATGC